MDSIANDLRYIRADYLSTAEGGLVGAPVVSRADESLGTLKGALVDPTRRNVCYLVIDSGQLLGRHRYLLPLGTTRFDPERRALLVDADAADLQEVPLDEFAPSSEQDLIDTMF
jgi:hypothetical protein